MDFEKNRNAKNLRYNTLIQALKTTYRKAKFINLSLDAIGVYSKSQGTFSDLLSDLEVDKAHSSYVLSKISNAYIQTTYYLFCLRDEDWTDPTLLSWQCLISDISTSNLIQFHHIFPSIANQSPIQLFMYHIQSKLCFNCCILLFSYILLYSAIVPWQSSSLCLQL